ncbi:hypothetical protein AAGW05_12665 [Arthrobacter sp. LAPM80]|uniref:hypothetical protein n=1 Tax=Arthrobacter sp. LAPM80 TaxID=3141788 RepID=UPI00398B4CBD
MPHDGASTPVWAPTEAPTPTQASVEPAEQTFTTPGGSLSFTHPVAWTVTPVADQPNTYVITDATGGERATLRDKVESLPFMSASIGTDTTEKAAVMASLTLHPDKVQAVGCLGAKYKYLKLNGIRPQNISART